MHFTGIHVNDLHIDPSSTASDNDAVEDEAVWRLLGDRLLFPPVYRLQVDLPAWIAYSTDQRPIDYDLVWVNGDEEQVSHAAECSFRPEKLCRVSIANLVPPAYLAKFHPLAIESAEALRQHLPLRIHYLH